MISHIQFPLQNGSVIHVINVLLLPRNEEIVYMITVFNYFPHTIHIYAYIHIHPIHIYKHTYILLKKNIKFRQTQI